MRLGELRQAWPQARPRLASLPANQPAPAALWLLPPTLARQWGGAQCGPATQPLGWLLPSLLSSLLRDVTHCGPAVRAACGPPLLQWSQAKQFFVDNFLEHAKHVGLEDAVCLHLVKESRWGGA